MGSIVEYREFSIARLMLIPPCAAAPTFINLHSLIQPLKKQRLAVCLLRALAPLQWAGARGTQISIYDLQ